MAARTDWVDRGPSDPETEFNTVYAADLNALGAEVNTKADADDVDGKVDGNSAVTGATKTKITYDAKGLVTAGVDATQDDIVDGTTYKRYSSTEKTKLAAITGTNTGDQNLSGLQPLDADLTALAALTAPATKLSGIATGADVTSATNVGSAIHGATAKTAPVSNDEVPLIDSAASNVLKRITYGDLSTAIVALIAASAPSTLDTLQELAAALGDDPNFAATITAALGLKAPLASPAFTGTPTGITKTHVGLGNVDNTSNATERAAVRTLTNARITPRVNSATSNATPALDATYDATVLTAQAAAITAFSATNTFTAEQKHMLRIKDSGTARAITWTSTVIVAADGITLPTTTVVGKTHRIGLIYDEVIGKLVAWAVGTV